MHDLRKLVGAACLLAPFLTCSNFGPGSALAAEPARSTYIADVTIDGTSLRRLADESDNFHLTWHADDALYGAYGDGWGFVKTSIPKRAIGVSRITGAPPELKGQDVWEGSGQGGACCWADWNGKSWGMLATGTDLHMWFTQGRPRALGFTEARLATSSDGGRSWRKADWAFTAADRMLMPSFLQLGRGYHAPELPAEITDYVYSYHSRLMATPGHVQTPGRVDLVRVPKGRIAERAAYQFFAGHGPDGAALWTSDITRSAADPGKAALAGHAADSDLEPLSAALHHGDAPRARSKPEPARDRLLRSASAMGPLVRDQDDRGLRRRHGVLLPAAGQMAESGPVRLAGLFRHRRAGRPGMGRAEHRQGAVRAGAAPIEPA